MNVRKEIGEKLTARELGEREESKNSEDREKCERKRKEN